jgi:hypothetical protein
LPFLLFVCECLGDVEDHRVDVAALIRVESDIQPGAIAFQRKNYFIMASPSSTWTESGSLTARTDYTGRAAEAANRLRRIGSTIKGRPKKRKF